MEGHGDGPAAPKLLVRPPDLPATVGRRADGYLYATIRNGGPLIPSFGSRIPPAERWDLVNYLRSIAIAAPDQNISQALGAPAPSSPPAEQRGKQEAKGDAARGKQVFEANCQLCHSADTEEMTVGPGLKGLFHWPPHMLSDGTEHKEHTVEIIRKQIVEGGGDMAPVGASFSNQEMADLIAYLRTL
jgi:mono/diheme cytochrome c family protein